MQQPNVIAPPPWHLTGDAYVMLYRFPKEFVEKHAFLADYQEPHYKGLVGTVMLVNYKTSGVGPYQELLFIPGLFDFEGKKHFSISKIYVSSYDSVWNGIENWGIPKELADFEWNDSHVCVRVGEEIFFEARFSEGSWLSFPMTTAILPLSVVQKLRDKYIFTNPSAKGKARFAKLKDVKVNARFFPDLSLVKPLMTLKISDFQMTFPVPAK
jgi:hypothetical protein